jgi:hypothetical protein
MKWMLPLMAFLALALPMAAPAAPADDWELVRNDSARDLRVYLRDSPGSGYKRFYATTRVQASLSTVVAALSDVPAMPQWISRMSEARLLRRDGNREAWVHSVYKLPYPFVEREAVLHSTLRQLPSGVVEITTRAEPGFIPANTRRVRLTRMSGLWRLTPENKGTVKIELWGEGEPGGYVPHLLFNYNIAGEPQQTLRNLRQMVARDKYRAKKLPYIREPAGK